MSNLTQIKLHGILGEQFQSEWKLNIESVAEAIHAIEVNTKRRFCKQLIENDKNNIKYRVLVNGEDVIDTRVMDINNIESMRNCELTIKRKIEKIDIVPVIEGAGFFDDIGDWFNTIVGISLAIYGLGTGSSALFFAGVQLASQGIANLLAEPPEYEDFRDIEQPNKRASYLFNGATNTVNEGGPVPVGYGRLIVGSQVISVNQEVRYTAADDTSTITT